MIGKEPSEALATRSFATCISGRDQQKWRRSGHERCTRGDDTGHARYKQDTLRTKRGRDHESDLYKKDTNKDVTHVFAVGSPKNARSLVQTRSAQTRT